MNKNKFYVYHIINPITNRIFYVGKGTGNRCKQHLTDKKEYAFNKSLNGYIMKLIKNKTPPLIIKIAENLSEEIAYDLEEDEIKKYGRVGFDEDGILLNILESGRPPKFEGENHPWWRRSHTEESKKKISNTKKENFKNGKQSPRNGFTHTQETKEKISKANRGKKKIRRSYRKNKTSEFGKTSN